jgi:hypothetical protein
MALPSMLSMSHVQIGVRLVYGRFEEQKPDKRQRGERDD